MEATKKNPEYFSYLNALVVLYIIEKGIRDSPPDLYKQ